MRAQHADGEPNAGKLDHQPGTGQHQLPEALTVHGGALALPERPVTVASERHYRRHDDANHTRGLRFHACLHV